MWTSNRSTDGQTSGLPLQKQSWKILAMLWRLFTSSWVAEGLTTRPPAQNPKKRWCSGWKHFGPLICSKSFYAFYFKLHTYNSCYCLKQIWETLLKFHQEVCVHVSARCVTCWNILKAYVMLCTLCCLLSDLVIWSMHTCRYYTYIKQKRQQLRQPLPKILTRCLRLALCVIVHCWKKWLISSTSSGLSSTWGSWNSLHLVRQRQPLPTKNKKSSSVPRHVGMLRLDKKLGSLTDPSWKKKSSNAPTRVGMFRLND